MKTQNYLSRTGFAILLALSATACGSREVEVSGEVASSEALGSTTLRLEFYDTEAGEGEGELVHSVELDALGEFSEMIDLDGDEVRIVAIIDRDDDEACTDGEPWVEAVAEVSEDDEAAVQLSVVAQSACPEQ